MFSKVISMNMRFYFIIISTSILLQIEVRAQNDSLICSEKVKAYYKNVFSAEDSIIIGKYSEASKLYNKAFSLIKPFCNDLKNAVFAEIYGKRDSVLILKYLYHVVNFNCDTEFLSNSIIKNLPFYNYLVGNLNKKHVVQNKINNTLDIILKDDQHIRDSCRKVFGADFYEPPLAKKRIMYIDSLNLLKIQDILDNYNIDSINKNGLFAMNIVILHNNAWHRLNILYKIKDLVLKGKFDARVYAELICRLPESYERKDTYKKFELYKDYGLSKNYVIGKYMFTEMYDDSTLKEVNNDRRGIFLESFENYIKKLQWQYNQKLFHFSTMSIFAFSKEDENSTIDLLKKMKSMIFIEKK